MKLFPIKMPPVSTGETWYCAEGRVGNVVFVVYSKTRVGAITRAFNEIMRPCA